MLAILLFFGLLASLLLYLILYARKYRGTLEKMGIPIVETHWLLGSLGNLHKMIVQQEDIRRFKKFGPIYGVYEGRIPIIHINDPDLVKSIMSSDYKYFSARAVIDLGHPISNEILDYLPTEKWKTVRNFYTPSLTAGKVKGMSKDMEIVFEEHCARWEEEMGSNDRLRFDFRNRIITILIDFICTSLCGVKIEGNTDPNNMFCRTLKAVLCEHVQYNFIYNLTLVWPFLRKILPPIFPNEAVDTYASIIRGIIAKRLKEGVKKNDILEVTMDMIRRSSTEEYKKLGITENTALAQLLEIFFAGYDSTGSGIAMLGYHMAKYPEIQRKVHQEVDEVIIRRHKGQVTHESVAEMPYLTAALNEALRVCPPFIRPERLCTQDWTDPKTGLKIPKDQIVVFPLWALHRNPEAYEDPEEFKPERFLPENKDQLNPFAFTSFGHGMKNCIGINLAYENSKMIMCRLLRDYALEEREGETRLNYKLGTLFVAQYRPFFVDLVKRKKNI